VANPHPDALKARMAKKCRQRTGDLPALQRKLWRALLHAEDVLEQAEAPELRLRAVHAVSQCAGQYAKLLEVGELEARLAALEEQMRTKGPRR
jgi:hypothetical protein